MMDSVYQAHINLDSLPTKHEPNEIDESAMKECVKQMDQQTLTAIQFYCNIMSRSEFCASHEICNFTFFNEYQSQQKLKELFSNYPELFNVQNNKVILKNWIVFQLNQEEWLKELLPKSYQSLPNFQITLSIIQFICNMIFAKGHRYCSQMIFNTKRYSAIKAIMKTQEGLLNFLSKYPEIFILKEDNVTLTCSAASYKDMTSWIKRMVSYSFYADGISGPLSVECNTLFEGKSLDIWKNDVVTNDTIGFYYQFLWSIPSLHGKLFRTIFTSCCRKCPSKTVIKKFESDVELKAFLSSYPEVFIIKNHTVFLKNFKFTKLIVSEPGSTHQLNFSGLKEDDLDSKNNEKLAIEFYANIVRKIFKDNDITEFPVNHLFNYSLEAPLEVKAIANNVLELKTLLLKNPNIFKMNNDNITINKAEHESSLIEIDPDFKNPTRDAVNSYLDLIYQHGGRMCIGELLIHIKMFTKTVKIIDATSVKVKQFLSSYPNRFIVQNDQVIITGECIEKMNSIYHAIDFFLAYMIKEKNKSLPLSLMIDYRRFAPPNVQEIAKNTTELKAFLSKFPHIFSVINDSVTLSNPQEYNLFGEDKGCLMENDCIDFNDPENVVNCFSRILHNHGVCQVLTIQELFEFKLNSSTTIQRIYGFDIHQFINFLMQYPDYFLITGNYVIARNKIPKCLNYGKYKTNKFMDPSLILIINFFRKYTIDKSLFNIDYLFNVGRYFLYNDRSPFFKTKNDLLSFLALYPNVFYVDHQRVLNLVTSAKKSKIYDKNNKIGSKVRDRKQNKFSISKPKPLNFFSKLQTNKSWKHNAEQRLLANSNILSRNTLLNGSSIEKNNLILKPDALKSNIEDENISNMCKSAPVTEINIASNSKKTSILVQRKIKTFLDTSSIEKNNLILKPDKLKPNIEDENASNMCKSTSATEINIAPDSKKTSILVQRKNGKNSNSRHVSSIKEDKKCFTKLRSVDVKESIVCYSDEKQQLQAASCSNTLENSLSIESEKLIIKPNTSKSNILDKKTINIPDPKLKIDNNHVQTTKLLKTNECFEACSTFGAEQQLISYSDVLEHISSIEKHKWDKKFQNVHSRRFNRPSIREIERNIFTQFTTDTSHKKQPVLQCSDFILSKHVNSNNFLKIKRITKDLEKLIIEEALMFLNEKLWEGGELQILKISELYKLFFSESLQITQYYYISLGGFNDFLCKFNDDFIVSNNNVMAKKNKSRNIVEECIPIMFSNFFDMYTQNNYFITVIQLYERVGQHFYSINHTKFFKCSEQLQSFLEMFPDLFYIDNNLHVINLTSTRKNENCLLEVSKCDDSVDSFDEDEKLTTFLDPESSLSWKDLVLKRTQLVEHKNDCRRITEAILKSEKIIAVDCEGVNLGAAGILSLIQVGLESGDVYIFDVVKDKTMVIDGGLKEILESNSIVKVIHDCRNDAANLYTEYGVEISKVFDTRVAHHLIVNSGVKNYKQLNNFIAIGFNELCDLYGAPINIEKDEMKGVYKSNPMIWNERPLKRDMLAYAALDVACLVPQLYNSMRKQLEGISKNLIWNLSFKHSKSALY